MQENLRNFTAICIVKDRERLRNPLRLMETEDTLQHNAVLDSKLAPGTGRIRRVT
jgi:hypothetical protein